MISISLVVFPEESTANFSSEKAQNCLELVQVEGGEWKETDVHIRAREGKGGFNWRMKFPMDLPLPKGITERSVRMNGALNF